MSKVAILVDGEFFLRRYRKCFGENLEAKQVVLRLFQMCIAHARDDGGDKHSLYRIFFYDCEPLAKRAHRPISRRSIDFAKTETFHFRTELHEQLDRTRKVAIRLGRLATGTSGWRLKRAAQDALLAKRRSFTELQDNDFSYDVGQKGVDMKIGLDIATLAYKRLVDKIVLISGDTDFVPAAKLARREGIDFILDPMWRQPPADLRRHVDGLRSHCPNPDRHERRSAA